MENELDFEKIWPKTLENGFVVWVESAQNELGDRFKYYGWFQAYNIFTAEATEMKEVSKLPHLVPQSTGSEVPELVVESTADEVRSILNNYPGILNPVPAQLNPDGTVTLLGSGFAQTTAGQTKHEPPHKWCSVATYIYIYSSLSCISFWKLGLIKIPRN